MYLENTKIHITSVRGLDNSLLSLYQSKITGLTQYVGIRSLLGVHLSQEPGGNQNAQHL